MKKLCTSLRRNAKEERVLFHYNGHGVPRPTVNGEIWVFNKVRLCKAVLNSSVFFIAMCILTCAFREQVNFQSLKYVHGYLFGSLLTAVCFLHVLEVLRPHRLSLTSQQQKGLLRCTEAHCQTLQSRLLSLPLLFSRSTPALSRLGR